MRIAQLAPLWKTVPPKKYAGTELVVANLSDELTRQGHDVTVFACGGSKTKGKLVKVVDRPIYDLMRGFTWSSIPAYEFLEYDELFKRAKSFDIIHNHMGFHPLVFSKLIRAPWVTTCHSSNVPDFPFLANRFKDNNFVSISDAQRKTTPYLKYVATIYHGIETSKFKPDFGADHDYLLFIGSLIPEKGIDLAIRAAKELKQRLVIAGETRKEHQSFLDKKVLPYVDGKQIKLLGEIDFKRKVKLYSQARGLLFPVRWNEAFGLVMAESLACGTPVVAFDHGSVQEVIENNKTGFVVKSFRDFKEKIKQIGGLSRQECRKQAIERFDASVMAKNYVELYKKIIKQYK